MVKNAFKQSSLIIKSDQIWTYEVDFWCSCKSWIIIHLQICSLMSIFLCVTGGQWFCHVWRHCRPGRTTDLAGRL